jgi:hypothetical protein
MGEAGPRNRSDLVDHQLANSRQTGCVGGLHWKSQQRCFDLTCGEGENGDRGSCVEPVVLNDDDGARFAAVGTSGRGGVDVAPPHASCRRPSRRTPHRRRLDRLDPDRSRRRAPIGGVPRGRIRGRSHREPRSESAASLVAAVVGDTAVPGRGWMPYGDVTCNACGTQCSRAATHAARDDVAPQPALDTERRRLRNRAPTAAGWGEGREWAAVVDHAIHTHPHDGCINDVPIASVRVAFTVAVSGLA